SKTFSAHVVCHFSKDLQLVHRHSDYSSCCREPVNHKCWGSAHHTSSEYRRVNFIPVITTRATGQIVIIITTSLLSELRKKRSGSEAPVMYRRLVTGRKMLLGLTAATMVMYSAWPGVSLYLVERSYESLRNKTSNKILLSKEKQDLWIDQGSELNESSIDHLDEVHKAESVRPYPEEDATEELSGLIYDDDYTEKYLDKKKTSEKSTNISQLNQNTEINQIIQENKVTHLSGESLTIKPDQETTPRDQHDADENVVKEREGEDTNDPHSFKTHTSRKRRRMTDGGARRRRMTDGGARLSKKMQNLRISRGKQQRETKERKKSSKKQHKTKDNTKYFNMEEEDDYDE
ncbi:hypothetical protein Hamer_G021093, partial [Homarus americanus]